MRKHQNLKKTLWYFMGTIASAVLGLISAPLLTRLLPVDIYAQYGMIVTFSSLISTFIYMGQDESFMRFFHKRDDRFWLYFWKCIRWPLVMWLIVVILLSEPHQYIFELVFKSKLSTIVLVILDLYLLLSVIQRFLLLTARMEERAANYSISNVITKGGFLIAIAVIYLFKRDVALEDTIIALISGVFLATILNVTVLTDVQREQLQCTQGISSKEMLKYGLPFAFSTTLFFVVPMIEKIVIRHFTDWKTLAIYTAAAIFITVMSLLKQTVNSIWVPYVYKEYGNEIEFKKVFNTVGMVILWVATCILAFVILTRPWLVLIFDAAYSDVQYIAPALMCGATFDLMACIYSIGINIKGKTQVHILVPIIQILISIGLLIVLLPLMGLIATGIAYMFSVAVSRTIQIVIGLKCYGTGRSYKRQVILILIYLSAGILSCIYDTLNINIIFALSLIVFSTIISRQELIDGVKMLIHEKNDAFN